MMANRVPQSKEVLFTQALLGHQDLIIFASIRFVLKKIIKLNLKKIRNWFKSTDYGLIFLEEKHVQTGLARFIPV
jgi:hypothetical protein